MLETAVADTRTGDVTVALFAGVETFTVTRAETPAQAANKRHTTTIGGFHRISFCSFNVEPFAAAGWFFIQVLLNCASGWGIVVLSPRVAARINGLNGAEN